MDFSGVLGAGRLGAFELGSAGVSEGGGGSLDQTVESGLSLTQHVTAYRIIDLSVEHTLDMVSEVVPTATDQSVSSVLALLQDVEVVRIISLNVASQMVLASAKNFSISPLNLSVSSPLNIQQDVQTHAAVQNISVESEMFLKSEAHRVLDISVGNTLNLTSTGSRTIFGKNEISLSQEVHVGRQYKLNDHLLLQSLVNCTVVAAHALHNIMNIKQSLAYTIDRAGMLCNYTPQVGSGDSGITPPSITAPVLGSAILTLYYPYTSPTTTLQLNNPEFSNKEQFGFQRIYRESRAGTLKVFADPTWPKYHTLSFEFSYLSQTKADALLAFLNESLGKEIKLLDHENRIWRGIITNPDDQVSQDVRNGRSASITFEGELV
jgi:hypothetical protein